MTIESDPRFHINCDCYDEEQCKLFWNLDNFNDYEPDDEPDKYEEYEDDQPPR